MALINLHIVLDGGGGLCLLSSSFCECERALLSSTRDGATHQVPLSLALYNTATFQFTQKHINDTPTPVNSMKFLIILTGKNGRFITSLQSGLVISVGRA
jgi:hypothetical protein